VVGWMGALAPCDRTCVPHLPAHRPGGGAALVSSAAARRTARVHDAACSHIRPRADAEEDARAKILAEASEAIAAQGELLRHDVWGERALTYPIDHKTAAEYHLLQFHAATPELLGDLDRSLRIADGIVRFRIVKLKPGTPAAPDMAGPASRTVELGAEIEPVAEAL
jgi:small subunit ribosomal protein S6